MAYDLIFRNATLYDGTGAPAVTGDLAVEGDRIAAIGSVAGSGAETIDATGLALSPGFIDVHTHDDFAAILYPDMGFKTEGGVTSCIVGNCGMGAAPFAAAAILARSLHPHAALAEWDGYGGYLARLDAQPPAVNIGALIGHGTARMTVMGRNHAAAVQILGSPIVAIVLALFVIAGVWHMKIGMQVVIEDYVHEERLKLVSIIANNFFSAVVALSAMATRLRELTLAGLSRPAQEENNR